MSTKRKAPRSTGSIPAGIGIAVAVSTVITILGAALCASLISQEVIGPEKTGLVSTVILVLSAAAGAITAMRLIGRLRMQMCLAAGGCYYLLLLSMTALFFEGQYEGLLPTAIAVLAGSGAVAILSTVIQKKGGIAGKKMRYR